MAKTLEHRETERLRAEKELEKVRRQQQLILDSAWEGIIALDLQGNHTFVNPAAARLLGYKVKELLGSPSHVTWHHSRAEGIPYPEVECPIMDTLRRGKIHNVTGAVFWRKDGTGFQVKYSSTPIIENNEVVGGVVTFEDVSGREEIEELSQSLMAWAPLGIYIIQDGKFIWTNYRFQSITGYTADELSHKNVKNLLYHKDQRRVRTSALRILRGKSFAPYEYRTVTKGGEIRWIAETITGILYQGRRATLGYFMDITERKQLESQFLQAQKMEALGRLAGGLAHDFSNMMGIIIMYVAMILKDIGPDDTFYRHVNGIKEAAERAVLLTRRLLTLGRRQIMQPRAIDLNIIVIEIDKMLRHLIGEDIELVLTLCPTALVVKVDPGQLEQDLMNLAINARDAMPQGGRLTIETADVLLDYSNVSPGPYAMLAVSDTGTGMDKEVLTHIFDPLFTTKKAGRGSGLGLYVVWWTVKNSGGFIEVHSEPGQGTTFRIFLPRTIEALQQPTKIAESAPLQGSETILVVEDEDKLRELISDGLRGYGYTVLTARHGEEALLICERHQGPIHLTLTDMVMQKMSGRELAERLGSVYPEMKILYMSGYPKENDIYQEMMDGIFIQKPFSLKNLAGKVRNMLDSIHNI